ncbi:MAG: cbb3-type cytochrome c oxidase subunit II [Opitutaceae bacterium]
MALSWGSIMLANHQLGTLAPHFDENEGKAFPERSSGIAGRGQLVYADLGCAACHTQQVRRPDFGTDQARGWGERQSFARDYIHQTRVQLGESRVGPDLANLAGRKTPPDAEDLTNLLYAGKTLDPQSKSQHPTYKFLFETREVVGQRAANAVKVANLAPGMQVVPTERARALITYLLSLNNSYAYPSETAWNTVAAVAKEGEHKAPDAKGGADAKAAPAKEAGHK